MKHLLNNINVIIHPSIALNSNWLYYSSHEMSSITAILSKIITNFVY